MTRDIVNKILGGPVLESEDVNGAVNFLVKKRLGHKPELLFAVNQGAAQEVVEFALQEGWTPKAYR